jgi:ketosteroid isomerase-like protein
MSNLDLARRHIDASERQDEAAVTAMIAPDAVWDLSRSMSPYRGVYTGHEQIREVLLGTIEAWEGMRFEVLDVHEREPLLALEIRARMRGRGSGVEIEAQGARVYEFRGGKIAHFVMFQDMEAARAFVDAQP